MNIVHQITKNCFPRKRLNILTAPAHERFQSNWSRLDHNFYLVHCPNGKTWDERYAKLPDNHTLVKREAGIFVRPDVEIDLVVSHNKFDNFQTLSPISKQFRIPLISIEHTAPVPNWPPQQIAAMRDKMRGDYNVFITDWSREQWGWKKDECDVIYHGVDSEVFKPVPAEKKNYILTTVNEYSRQVRHWCCGFPMFQEIVKNDLPWKNLGNDPGFSEPAKDINDLVYHHSEAAVFLNTASFSPIPMSVLEAMSCGGCVVSLASCEVPNIITHGENGFLGTNAEELRKLCVDLLNQPELRYKVGQNARKTIQERFSLSKSISNWDSLFRKAMRWK